MNLKTRMQKLESKAGRAGYDEGIRIALCDPAAIEADPGAFEAFADALRRLVPEDQLNFEPCEDVVLRDPAFTPHFPCEDPEAMAAYVATEAGIFDFFRYLDCLQKNAPDDYEPPR